MKGEALLGGDFGGMRWLECEKGEHSVTAAS